ncbi:zinc-ribbon domain containing protein [Aeoliella sp. SH292]|uniref:zinc-ribbon domain containing protein n=1 Tax=Aeoliella sp. SH292 TaxID=3454464 RepID=UPI003F97ED56
MPIHLFWGVKHLDYSTAVRAATSKQNFTVCPRHWYIDAAFHCSRCGESFVFTAEEQKFWYEELRFWVDSLPKECINCRRELRELKALQQEYDRGIAAALLKSTDIVEKRRLVLVIEAMEAGGLALADGVRENHRVLLSQIAKNWGPEAC